MVVLGAGKGRRLGSASGGAPKILLPIVTGSNETPSLTLLDLLVRAWKPWASRLHLVVGDTGPVREALRRQPLPSEIHLQPEPDGTVNALLRLAERLPERFVVVLGDCLLRGRIEAPAGGPFPGIGVWKEADRASVSANFAVSVSEERITAVEEKPGEAGSRLCGMGLYFLNRDFLETVADLPSNNRGRRELTDALDHFLARGKTLHASVFSGSYVNINTPADLQRARLLFGNP
ncbi:MAG TPA: sugar phosphate nucleotidyltransferase [Myxococcota bacterium]|nr:sugar phosphate nucleotidyltransferase [Myxococcota bacterium]